jgi:hypothetical protein
MMARHAVPWRIDAVPQPLRSNSYRLDVIFAMAALDDGDTSTRTASARPQHKGDLVTPIIAGRFEQETHARDAVEALRREGFPADDVSAFFLNPAGQHATFPIGGDRDASPGATEAHGGAVKGAAVGGAVGLGIGLAVSPILGPLGPLAGAGAGAYTGSLVGAFREMQDPSGGKPTAETPAPDAPIESGVPVHDRDEARSDTSQASARRGGVIVAARAVEHAQRIAAVNVLRSAGAQDIERADGTWEGGRWTDFDPLKAPALIDPAEPASHAGDVR